MRLCAKSNIKLGIFYLGQLAKKFQSELIYTAGGYNAGPHNMKKWINRWNGMSLDNFVEEIPFNETRNYVKPYCADCTVTILLLC